MSITECQSDHGLDLLDIIVAGITKRFVMGYGVIPVADAVLWLKLKHLLLSYVVRRRHFQSAIILKDEQSMFRFPSGIVPSKETYNPFW